METQIISVTAAIVSIILGILAIVLSLWFYRQTKDTEKEVSRSLSKIETQAEMLQKITGKQLDRLTKFVTEPRKEKVNGQLNEVLKLLPKALKTTGGDSADIEVKD